MAGSAGFGQRGLTFAGPICYVRFMRTTILVLAVTALWAFAIVPASADMLGTVKARGKVLCGESPQAPGFSAAQGADGWSGLGADYCKGLAAVIFDDATKVDFVPLAPEERTAALTSGQVDALADLIPWTLDGDTEHGLKFVGTMYYDGQGFMTLKTSRLRSARDLAGKSVCVVTAGNDASDASEYFDANNIAAKLVPFDTSAAAVGAYVAGQCIALSADASVLAGIRTSLAAPGDHVLLPDIITKDPLALVVRQGDDRWFDIARWTFYAMLDAEELGVGQGNVDEMVGSDNLGIRRLLGVETDFGAELGLSKDWAYQLIKTVGNYSDVYERNVGSDTTLRLPRGLNALWNKGGIQYAPAVR